MGHKPFVPEKAPGYRLARLASRIKEELMLLMDEVKDKRLKDIGMITVTNVLLSPDYKNATVMFSVTGEERRSKSIENGLNAAAGFLRVELRNRLQTKVTPILSFKFDKGTGNTSKIDELFKQLEAERVARGETTTTAMMSGKNEEE